MEFGRHHAPSEVDFRLPDPDPRSVELLSRSGSGSLQLRVGTPRWAHDSLHAANLPARERLSAYAADYTCIELNATFHAVPEARTVSSWAAAVPPPFRFCPKVPQAVSHAPDHWQTPAQSFAEVLPLFGNSLGYCFFQAPPEVGPEDTGAIFTRIAALRTPMALELRNPGFFHRGRLAAPLFSRMVAKGVSAVVTDTPGRRDVVHMSLTTPTLLLRFMGDAEEPSTRLRLEAWAERLRWWGSRGLREAYVFVHQPDNLLLPELAALARQAFGELCLTPEGPKQGRLFGG